MPKFLKVAEHVPNDSTHLDESKYTNLFVICFAEIAEICEKLPKSEIVRKYMEITIFSNKKDVIY